MRECYESLSLSLVANDSFSLDEYFARINSAMCRRSTSSIKIN